MTLAQKYGLAFHSASFEAPAVKAFVLKHYVENGIPLETVPSAEHWKLITKQFDDGYRVLATFGWRLITNGSVIEITDFYRFPDRWGVRASFAAMERIKADSDRSGLPILTATPPQNELMVKAYKRFFEVDEPALVVYKYIPKAVVKEEVA